MTEAELMAAGPPVTGGSAKRPERIRIEGEYAVVEPLDPVGHSDDLWQSAGGWERHALWKYMHSGPFAERPAFDAYLAEKAATDDPMYFTIVDRSTGKAAGHAAYMRIDASQRVIEVGAIVFTPKLQKTRAATEAMYLMARHVFEDLGYRRYEWKCNVLNEGSQTAARRLGFTFEGVFRQHMIVKGRSRDTAWYAMLDSEWPARKARFERWLAAENFDSVGRQRVRLNQL